MGMYDTVTHNMKCPKCGKAFEFSEQIKWTNDCAMIDHKVGSMIDAADGEYCWATWARPKLIAICPYCHNEIKYKIIVKDNILKEIIIM